MKKLTYCLVAASALFAMSCTSQNNAPATDEAAQGDPYETTINIRYVVQDSILKNYTYAEAIAQANQQLQMEQLAYENQLSGQAQNLQNQFNQKLQNNGFLTESAAQNEAKNIQQKLANYERLIAQRRGEMAEKQAANLQALQDSINNFIIEFNKASKYDAILYKENCLYLNPALDITQEVVDGLNARYKVAVPAADAKDAAKK